MVRKNLKRAQSQAARLLDAINALDGNAKQLICDGRPDAREAITGHLLEIMRILHAGQKRADELPKGEQGLPQQERTRFAAHAAWAIQEHLSERPTPAVSGIYAQVLATLVARIDHAKGTGKRKRQDPDVRSLMKAALKLRVLRAADGTTIFEPADGSPTS